MSDDTITPHDLMDADVLLYRGTSVLSKAIVLLDGSRYSHSALHLAVEGVNHFVVEAVSAGVTKDSLDQSIAGQMLVSAKRLPDTSLDKRPVLAVAARYLAEGDRYAYEQIILLAFLCLTRKIPLPTPVKWMLRTVLDRAADVLEQMFSAGKQPMICSELVFRCFDEADPAQHDAYTLEIDTFKRMAAIPRATGVMPQGRGVHPDSLLAAVVRAQIPAYVPEEMLNAKPPAERPQGSVEDAVNEYLSAVRAGSGTAAHVDVLLDEELISSVDGFAVSLAKAQRRPEARSFGEAAPVALQIAAMRNLAQTVADFVTPGDLARTISLIGVGDLVGR